MLSDKQIVITGASSGIGRQISITCNALNASTLLFGRNKAELEITRDACCYPEKVSIAVLDLTGDYEIASVIEGMGAEYINGIVHCAGVSYTLPIKQHSSISFEKTFGINLIGGVTLITRLSDSLAPLASIVLVSSVMSMAGQKAKHSYCASKGAVDAAVRSMSLELASRRIRVNAVLPSVVETPLAAKLFTKIDKSSTDEIIAKHPLGLGKMSDVSDAVTFLLSNLSRSITGQSIVVDGGYLAQ